MKVSASCEMEEEDTIDPRCHLVWVLVLPDYQLPVLPLKGRLRSPKRGRHPFGGAFLLSNPHFITTG